MCVALLQEGVTAAAHLGSVGGVAVDVEGGKLSKLSFGGDAETEHVLFLAGDGEVVLLSVVTDYVDLLEVVLAERVRLEHGGGCDREEDEREGHYGK